MSRDARQMARQRLQTERGTIVKPDGQARIRFALAYPNTYYIGMSNLGMQTMYRVINQRPDTVCERVFLPDSAERAAYTKGNTPLFTLESQRPVNHADIIGFSMSYENDYLHLLHMLELARIPLLAAERDERYPIILVGGAVTYINPEPLADFVAKPRRCRGYMCRTGIARRTPPRHSRRAKLPIWLNGRPTRPS
jgi:hypothetical protein